MGKKAMRREIAALEQRLGSLQLVEATGRERHEKLMEDLASVGLIRVEGDRTREDRLRAARAGVLVLDDVAVLPDSQITITQNEVEDWSYGSIRAVRGPIEARLRLEVAGDPEILDLLAEHLRSTF